MIIKVLESEIEYEFCLYIYDIRIILKLNMTCG